METNNYPYIGEAKVDDTIVLFSSKNSGIVLYADDGYFHYLEYSSTWIEKNFELYIGDNFILPINSKGYPKLMVWCNEKDEIKYDNTCITLFVSDKTGLHLNRSVGVANDTYSDTLVSCKRIKDGLYRWRDYSDYI